MNEVYNDNGILLYLILGGLKTCLLFTLALWQMPESTFLNF